jgi:hypothetical protein
MDDPTLIKTLSRRQIGRLERFGESRVPARRSCSGSALALRISADYGLPASQPFVSCHIRRPRKGDHGSC